MKQGPGVDDVLMPSTPLAYPQVDRGCFASFRVVESSIPQFTPFFAPGSIPGSSTTKMWQQFLRPRDDHQKVPQKPGRAQIYSDGVVESDDDRSPIPHIYTLREAANAPRVPGEWLRTRLANGTFAGLRRGSRWAMTEQQILAVIESMTVPAREPESYPGGLSRRSWLYHIAIGRPKALDKSKAALAQRMHAGGEPASIIAASLGVSRATIYRVLAGEQ